MPPRHSSSPRVPRTLSLAGHRCSRTAGGPQGFGKRRTRFARGRDISISFWLSAVFLGRLFLRLWGVGGGYLGCPPSTDCAGVDSDLASAVLPCPSPGLSSWVSDLVAVGAFG